MKLAGAFALLPLCASLLGAQAGPRPAPTPSYKDLKYPPLPPIQLPRVDTYTLPNGIRLYLVENHELPLVSGFALVRTGNLFDPQDKVGLAEVTGTVLRSGGTRSKTGDQLDEQLENLAASVESSIGESSGRISFSALRENTDEVLRVFKEVLTEPEFRQEKIDLAKTQLRSAISRRNDSASDIASRELSDTVYGKDTPYGWRIEYEHLDRIQREDVAAFYRRYFFPANILLAVYGDFQVSEMKPKLEALLGAWDARQQPVPTFPPVAAKPRPGVYWADKEDVTQTFFRLGHLGGILRDRDYPALAVAADIFGGGFRSRLFRKVRTELGFAYAVFASWGANYDHPGLLEIGGSTKSASTVETLKVIRQELDKIRSAEVTDEELATAKDTVLNSFVFNFDTPGKTLSRYVNYEYYGYPKDFIFQYQKGVAAVTKADILRVAKEHFKPENLTIVAAGNPKELGEPLKALGLPVQQIDLTIPEPKQEGAKSDSASLEKGRQLLQALQKAVGGADRLASVKDVTAAAEADIQAGPGSMKARKIVQWVAPSHLRQDQELPFGKVVAYSDGSGGWLSTPQGMMGLTGPFLQQMKGEIFRLYFPLWLSDRTTERSVNLVKDGVVEISDSGGNSVRLEVDAASGLPLKQIYRASAGMGPPGDVEEAYSDWKEVDGLRLPFKVTLTQDGRKVMDVTYSQYKLNTGLTAEEVSKKP